ncbi:MAG: hypothetical protein KDA92_24115 [Planctomycetales bacterium]|nr:hypothetical protein [Planctomycetales bacterium]MCA9169543.1 hypothetical protein [Planctomycetales bacterium]
MPIEFSCPNCQTRLRVPDGSSGQLAQCPNCGNQSEIPDIDASSVPPPIAPIASPPPRPSLESTVGYQAASTPYQDASERFGAPPTDALNPYAAPPTVSPDYHPSAVGGIEPRRTSVGEIMDSTWRVVRDNLGQVALLGIVMFALVVLMQILTFMLTAFLGIAADQNEVMAIIAFVLMMGLMSVTQSFVFAFVCKASLNIARFGDMKIEELPQVLSKVPRLIAIYVCITIITMLVGFVSAFVFALIAALMPQNDFGELIGVAMLLPVMFVMTLAMLRFMFAFHFVLDQNNSISAAISNSIAYTRGNTLSMFGAGLLLYILVAIVTLLTLLIGAVVTVPSLIVAMSVTYLLITGQMSGSQTERIG